MRFPLNLSPDRVAFHSCVPRWEAERLDSMHERLNDGDVIVDVGSECGDFPSLWASWGCRVVCVEPNPAYWPAIRWHFEANNVEPLRCWVGFAGDTGDGEGSSEWPDCSMGRLSPDDGFRHLAFDECPSTTLDALCAGVKVDALTIDVEGSELRVLKGAERILREDRPHSVWVSVHTDEAWMAEHYPGEGFDAVAAWMASCGYDDNETLAVDHERHVLWRS